MVVILLNVSVAAALNTPAEALVVCKKRTGVIALRDACMLRETQVDSAEVLEALRCPPDALRVGPVCIDKHESLAVRIPVTAVELIEKVQAGEVTYAELTAGGALPLGCSTPPWNYTAFATDFPSNGQWTPVAGSDPPSPGVYAVSVPGVFPSTCITWFQAEQACALSGKRLLTNQEWQRAAAGTPDPGLTPGPTDCNTNSAGPDVAGNRGLCKSSWGVVDMVGNVHEWVADWDELATTYTFWPSALGNDESSVGGNGSGFPGALFRGGDWGQESEGPGVFAVRGDLGPLGSFSGLGFRCAR